MGEVRSQSRSRFLRRSNCFDQAQYKNSMQSRKYMNQIEVLELDLRKKLKIIENEKIQASRYLQFLRTSSGISFTSLTPRSKWDILPKRPNTAQPGIMKFGVNGNHNHNYMSSNAQSGFGNKNSTRIKSADISSSSIGALNRTLERVKKIEKPLRKRVSWSDTEYWGDEEITEQNVEGTPRTTTGTQYMEQYERQESATPDVEDPDKTTIEHSAPLRPTSRKSSPRKVKTIQPINITFPFPVTPNENNPKQKRRLVVTPHPRRSPF